MTAADSVIIEDLRARLSAAEQERDRLGDASYDWEMAYIAAEARAEAAEQARDSYAESLRLTSDALQAEEDKADAAQARAEAAEQALETLATAEDFVDEEDYQAFARAALAGREERPKSTKLNYGPYDPAGITELLIEDAAGREGTGAG